MPFSRRLSARVLAPMIVLVALLSLPAGISAQQSGGCQFVLGFKTLHDLDPEDVGDCVESQSFTPNGDAVQHTTRGMMVWRKADNWTAFTNGYFTWINGPDGLERRLNTDRFLWEGAAPPASPTPEPAPQPTPQPLPVYPWYFKRVTESPTLCGPGQALPCVDSAPNAGVQYISGHAFHKDNTPAPGIIIQARVGNMPPLYGTTGDDGVYNILFATNCPRGPINFDVYVVDGGMQLASYVKHLTYTDCRQAGEFHVDFVEYSPPAS